MVKGKITKNKIEKKSIVKKNVLKFDPEKKIFDDVFKNETKNLAPEFKKELLEKEKAIKDFVNYAKKYDKQNKIMGFFINFDFVLKNKIQVPNFKNLKLTMLFDDADNNMAQFNPIIFFGKGIDKKLDIKKIKDKDNNVVNNVLTLKKDKKITFETVLFSQVRENCFDSNYEIIKQIGGSIIYEDGRGFLLALKTISIHKDSILQKFEKYVVAYVGAGSWIRGEKSNDFDVFIIIDDTDVKRMPREQVKEQLTGMIWKMSQEIAQFTGIQIHIQVYLLTDFWDSLKDAHPVIFTFLRDGIPFYDRGIYNSWKELLKLGKIRPSEEAIDMHMNVGVELVQRAKKSFADLITNNIYWAILNPSQAILMLKGYNPTTPKETINMFENVLLKKEKIITKKDLDILKKVVATYKAIEHDKKLVVKGSDIDEFLKDSEYYLKKIKTLFQEISEQKTKVSFLESYQKLMLKFKELDGISKVSEKMIISKFEELYVKKKIVPKFVETSINEIESFNKNLNKKKYSQSEFNKIGKDIRLVLSELKTIKNLSEIKSKQPVYKTTKISYLKDKKAELFNYDKKTYLYKHFEKKLFMLNKTNDFKNTTQKINKLDKEEKYTKLKLDVKLIGAIERTLDTREIFIE